MATNVQRTNNTRALAAQLLATLLQNKSSLSQLLTTYTAELDPRDRGFVAELCFGTLRHQPELAGLVAQLLNKPMKAKDSDVQALLLLGTYQLRYMRVPDHAAIGETVAATRVIGKPWAKGLINGVLRNVQRRSKALEEALPESAKLNHPAWLLEKFRSQWPIEWPDIVAANNLPPPMTIRVNQCRHSRDEYLQILGDSGISASPCLLSGDGIQLLNPVDVDALPGFDSGSCSVQDEASQLVASLLDEPATHPQSSNRRLLDSCCAPGGKTSHLLERNPNIILDAVDVDSHRLLRVEDNLSRLKLSANIITGDSKQPEQWWDGKPYDAILLDAPCSASGVIRRHPDIKIMRKAKDIPPLVAQQLTLLGSLWPCLKPGGKLVYTTCSIFTEENAGVIGTFIGATSDAQHEPIQTSWGYAGDYGRQLLPEVDAHDGFYFACVRKRALGPI